eukprot:scaffold586_cov155-Amphora_coffeaeformis.AAC.7
MRRFLLTAVIAFAIAGKASFAFQSASIASKRSSRFSSRLVASPLSDVLAPKHASALKKLQHDFGVLSGLRPSDPSKDTSAPVAIISAGSSYTRLWTANTWKAHSRPPHRRYLRHAMRWIYSTTARKVMPTVLIATIWAGTVSMWAQRSSFAASFIPSAGSSAVLSYLAAPLGLLLTLRTNQSMSRLLEARQAWGRLTLHARSLASVAAVYLYPMNPRAAVLLVRYLATLGWVLKAHVRDEGIESDRQVLSAMLEGDELDWILQQSPRTNAIMSRMRAIVGAVMTSRDEGSETRVSTTLLVAEEKLAALEGVLGACTRLSTSPIPPTYTRHLSRTIVLWLLALPASLVCTGLSTFGVMGATMAATYVLVGLDEVGMEIENAFQLLPLQQLSAAVQKGVETQFFPSGGMPMPPVPRR